MCVGEGGVYVWGQVWLMSDEMLNKIGGGGCVGEWGVYVWEGRGGCGH